MPLWLGLGALLVSGCVSYTPHPVVPADELERLRTIRVDDLKIEYVKSGTPSEEKPLRFDARDGLDEAELASLAVTINPALRAKRAGIGEARALLISAGLLPNPEIGLFVRQAVGGGPVGFGFDALRRLLRPDERAAKRSVAEAQIEVVRAEIVVEELRLVSEVRRARIAVLSAEQVARLLQQELTVRDEAVALVRKQRELGEATELSLTLADLDRTAVQRQLRDAQAVSERERRVLNALLGVQPLLDIGLIGSGSDLAFTIVDDLSDDEIDARLLAGRVDLRMREADCRLAEQELRLTIARQYPNLSLGPSYEKDIEGSAGFGIGASIEVPLHDRNQGDIAAKAATRDRKRAEYVATLYDLRTRAFEARAQLRRARAEIEIQSSEVLPLVQRAETLFESALRARELSIFEWLAARSRAIQARRDLLDSLTRYASAAVELDAATGARFVTVMTETCCDCCDGCNCCDKTKR